MLAAVNWQKVISCCESTALKTSYSFLIVHEKNPASSEFILNYCTMKLKKRELEIDPELQ